MIRTHIWLGYNVLGNGSMVNWSGVQECWSTIMSVFDGAGLRECDNQKDCYEALLKDIYYQLYCVINLKI